MGFSWMYPGKATMENFIYNPYVFSPRSARHFFGRSNRRGDEVQRSCRGLCVFDAWGDRSKTEVGEPKEVVEW
jgi:hypothetical protein